MDSLQSIPCPPQMTVLQIVLSSQLEKSPLPVGVVFQGELTRSVGQSVAPPLQLLLEHSVLPILSIFSGPSFARVGSLPTGATQAINPEEYQSLFTSLVKPWLLLYALPSKLGRGLARDAPLFHLGAKQILPWPQYLESMAPVGRVTKA